MADLRIQDRRQHGKSDHFKYMTQSKNIQSGNKIFSTTFLIKAKLKICKHFDRWTASQFNNDSRRAVDEDTVQALKFNSSQLPPIQNNNTLKYNIRTAYVADGDTSELTASRSIRQGLHEIAESPCVVSNIHNSQN